MRGAFVVGPFINLMMDKAGRLSHFAKIEECETNSASTHTLVE
jgi:hypothetical protein